MKEVGNIKNILKQQYKLFLNKKWTRRTSVKMVEKKVLDIIDEKYNKLNETANKNRRIVTYHSPSNYIKNIHT